MNQTEKIKFANTTRYFGIAKNALENVERNVSERNNELKNGAISTQKIIKLADSVHNESIITVVFCTMTLEAFINEYGITNSSKSFFQNHLDNLSLISKFVLLPKLNNKPELETGKQNYQDLKWLINLRNDLTHFKAKEKDIGDINMEEPIKQKDFILEEHARKAMNTVEGILKILEPGKLEAFEIHFKIDEN